MITLKIDNKEIKVPEGTSILAAAKTAGILIPTLCHMNLHDFDIENKPGACRICVVEVAGRRNLAPACCTDAAEGMTIKTNTARVMQTRKNIVELMLSDHPNECLTCGKSGQCELQDLAAEFGIRQIRFDGEHSQHKKDFSIAIFRNAEKCILCRRCETMCNKIQTVGVLSAVERGFNSIVATAFDEKLIDTDCTFCGQCVAVCPTGALNEIDDTAKVIAYLSDPSKTVIVQTAPAVRAALGEAFGYAPGTSVTGKMAAALKQIGFDHVFDTDFAADLTIMEEGTELLGRLNAFLKGDKKVKLPLTTSCCPAWVNFFESQYPDLLDYPSTAKSPQQMFGAIAKSYFAEQLKIDRKDMIVVSVMPCVAKKYERSRKEFLVDGNPDVDIVLTTRELARLIRLFNIDFKALDEDDFDRPLGESTGAAVIFGATGGVMEAAVRTAYEVHTGKELKKIDFEELRGFEGTRKATIDIDGFPLQLAVVHGLRNARRLMDEVRAGKSKFHAIEVMSCPGGCIGGGGQPYHEGCEDLIKERGKALYREDQGKQLRKSHENPYIVQLYKDYLGEPASKKAHKLLHTHYHPK